MNLFIEKGNLEVSDRPVTNLNRPTELKTRTLSILFALPPFLFLMIFHDYTLVMVFLVLSFFTFQEYMRMVLSYKPKGFTFLLIALGLLLFYFSMFFPQKILQAGWYGFFILIVLWSFLDRSKISERVGMFLFGFLYCVVFPFLWVKTGLEFGRWMLFGYACIIWLNDIGAYLVGTKWGRHKIAPQISPGKSWEGFWGGMIFAGVGAVVVHFFFVEYWTVYKAIGIGILLAMVGFLGDLFESAIKREFQLKDSGQFLPGHGGFLDRFDSFFFAGPMIYLIQMWWGG